jgi:hypothetical protein
MSYLEKIEASEHKAHYKNIATKILKEMGPLRSLVNNSPTVARRWIWELIQNAKDVAGEHGVRIKIEFDQDSFIPTLNFSHDGKPFTAEDIRFLIEQISSKDRKKDDSGKRKKTGKFGTGFLTTHLLSEIVKVKGVAKEEGLDYVQFTMQLNRSGFEPEDIIDGVTKAKESIQDIDTFPPYDEYDETDFNTTFSYPLLDELSKSVAKSGLDDLNLCLPYTFAFMPEILSIECPTSGESFKNEFEPAELADGIILTKVLIPSWLDSTELDEFNMISVVDGFTSITIPVYVKNGKIHIQQIDEDVPKLFCDFPMLGTEKFHFPAIINNANFNPTDPRDGIFLAGSQRANPQVDENREIIKEAVQLYFKLLKYATEQKWENLHLLAQVRKIYDPPAWLDESWYSSNVLSIIRDKLLFEKIIRSADGELISILNADKTKFAWFPSGTTKEIRQELFRLGEKWFPHVLPHKNDVELWNRLIWKDCGKLTTNQLALFLKGLKTLSELQTKLGDYDAIKWLNEFFTLIGTDAENYDTILNTHAIFPNQNGDFCLKEKLFWDKGDIDDDFKIILEELDADIKISLANSKLNIEFPDDKTRDRAYAIREITTEASEKANDRDTAKHYKDAFKKLLIWFKNNPKDAQRIFPTLYKQKHLLYDDDEIMENFEKAEKLDELMKEFDIESLDEIRKLLTKSQTVEAPPLLAVTQEILLSMGISSLEEWELALEDKDLAKMFSHESVPTTDMFMYVQGLIKTANKAITEHLANLPDYDLSEMEQVSPTVFGGIQKHGVPIYIVCRPAYDGEVIIYYSSEKNALDYETSELWVDEGNDVKQITLGHILKTSNIVKFPI